MISAIVPIRDEKNVEAWLSRQAEKLPNSEIIVVDSSEHALSPPTFTNVHYHHCPDMKTRALAMNRGASLSRGEILLFLHADCELPSETSREVHYAIENGALGGAFVKQYIPSSPLLNIQSGVLNLWARKWGGGVVGTNAIFILTELFNQWNGYEKVPFLEDVLLFCRLRKTGRIYVSRSLIGVSSRRYQRFLGIPRIMINTLIYFLYLIGLPPEVLRRMY